MVRIDQPRPTITDAPAINNAIIHPRADPTTTASIDPALCGFVDGTSATYCEAGQTCKFNTDYYAVGCCTGDDCNFFTQCCAHTATTESTASLASGGLVNTCAEDIIGTLVGVCPSTRPYCGIQRYENGYTYVKCWSSAFPPTQSILFTSKGETTAAPGLPRLTGSNGPPSKVTSVTSSSTSAINETGLGAASGSSGASAGVIAGSAVGGAVAGILVTLLAVFMTLYFRKRRAMEPEPQYTNVNTVPTPMFSPAGSSGYPPGMVANEMQGISSGLSPPLGAASTRYYSPGTSPSPGFKDQYNGQSHPVEIPVNSPGIHELGSGQGFDQGQRFDIEPRRA